MLSYTELLCAVCLLLIAWWYMKSKSKYPQPPAYPGAWPIIGHAHMLLGSCEKIWESTKKFSDYSVEVGGVARVFVGPITIYMLTDPDDFSIVMNKCLDKAFLYEFAKPWAGSGLITSDVTSWKRNRKLFAPFFNQRAVNMYLDIFNSQSKRLVEQLGTEVGKGTFDHYAFILENMLETIVQTTLGPGYDDGSNTIDSSYILETDNLLDLYIERLQKVWLQLSLFYNMSEVKTKQDEILNKIRAKTLAVIRKRKIDRKNSEKNTEDQKIIEDTICKPLLDCILETFAESEGFTDDDIREHLETFILAAFDSTGRTVVFALNYIGAYPHVQERIYKELKEVFGDSNRDVNKDDIPKLVYLEAVLKETLRFCATTPLVGRDIQNDLKLKNYTIPGGETFICSLYGINRHPVWGNDATSFRPERWLEERPPGSIFAGFSFGKRNCLGELYALSVMKTNLVHIFRRYRISAERTDLLMKYHVLLKPVQNHYISIDLLS